MKNKKEIFIGVGILILFITIFFIGRCTHKPAVIPDHTQEISAKQKSYDSLLNINTILMANADNSNKRFDSAMSAINDLKSARNKVKKSTNDKIAETNNFTSDDIIGYWTNQSTH